MESFKGEKFKGMNFGGEERGIEENKEIEKILGKNLFEQKEDFDYRKLKELARLEGDFSARKDKKNWPFENARRKCELKEILELTLLKMKPAEIENFWKANEGEYYDSFGRSRREEAKNSFNAIKSGVLNEIIAIKLFEKITGFPVKVAAPEIDINNKIDLFCFSEKILLAIQVKIKSIKDMKRGGENVVEEVGLISPEPKKNEFINGCLKLEQELNLKNLGIEMKKIWFTIPAEYKKEESRKYTPSLEEEAKKELGKIISLK